MSTLHDKRSRRTRAVRRTTRAAAGLLAVSAIALGATACDGDDADSGKKPTPAQSSAASDGDKGDGKPSPDASEPAGGDSGSDDGDKGTDKDKPSPAPEPSKTEDGESPDQAGYTCEKLPHESKIPTMERAVLGFLQNYKDAKLDGSSGAGRSADQVREDHIMPDYLKKLEDWEKSNHADGVFRAQNVPNCWDTEVLEELPDSGGKKGQVQATFKYGNDGKQKTVVVYEISYWEKGDGHAISDITEK
ncbi:hypothetical protein HUT18_25665 [Streptomyces sp. NA04227]|uniref:hypothetical protein n=1 Tax=Streptomyces sp. NA04227 TaxID=2742136 RepID=UPI00159062D0|nr:hypothetical protein [Streptomyces sp. NA04227]QKW09266.1 hypothetical protein HUT18_25665 [Streptomyces sp. NA04227]